MLLLTSLADDGRPFYNDDLDLLQTQTLGAATATFAQLGSFVLSGCLATPGVAAGTYDISPGMVWLGSLRTFPGAEAVTLPGYIGIGSNVTSGPRLFETGATKDAYVENRASFDTVASAGALAITVENPALTYWQLAGAQGRTLGLVEWLASYTPADYDVTGLGRGAARGWAVANGQNGTLDLRGRFALGQQADSGTGLHLLGEAGGAEQHTLTEAELPNIALRLYGSNDANGEGGFPDLGDDGDIGVAVGAGRYSDNAIKSLNTQGQPHDNMPPFAVLFARQWVGY